MKIASKLYDARIQATNVLVEISIEEYERLIKDIISNNEFQRKRVSSSKTVYALLREDLLKQCMIPPIVLAITKKIEDENIIDGKFDRVISVNKANLLILDGLQRTYTILDLLTDLRSSKDEVSLNNVLQTTLRVEIYIGPNRLGILYRMLTLNTGQTPMSLRQQIEMLYFDYSKTTIGGIELIRDSQGIAITKQNQYIFKDVIEGFNSYLDRDELPIDKANILENINTLEKLSKEDQNSELFEKFLSALNHVTQKFNEVCADVELSEDYINDHGIPFGKNINQIMKKPQTISGLGAAIGKLIDFQLLTGIDQVEEIIDGISINDPLEFLEEVNESLLWLKQNSKKIGNSQRSYFTFFFRDLLNKDSDTFKNPSTSNKSALRKYKAQNM